jgi:hypothetical protein
MASRTRLASTLVVTLAACGGEALTTSGDSDATTDARFGPDAPPGLDTEASPVDANDLDPCPSAVLPGAPRAMLANCSTRDGRSRVVGPTAPHLTFTTSVIEDTSGESTFVGIAADASGNVFLVVGDEDEDFGSFVRLDGSGKAAWMTSFAPLSTGYGGPLLLTDGTLEFLAADPMTKSVAFDRFEVASGALTPTDLPPALVGGSPDPAVPP